MMRPQFARDQVSDLDLEERHVQSMMSALHPAMQPDGWTGQVDLQVLFFRLTLDTATEFLFGESVNSQVRLLPSFKPTKEDALSSQFASAFDKGQMALATRARFADKYWVVNTKEFRQSCKLCHEFIDRFVRLALSKELREKELMKGASGVKEKYVFLEALARETQDPIELRSQLLHILLAGRDTTASLLGWLFLCLARDPVRFKKLREIIIADFGTYETPLDITFSKLKNCRYLQYSCNEALRLYPVVPINGRYANKDTTLPRGGGKDGNSPIFIPKGSSVDYSVHVMHHRKDIWGPDAEEFCPERWENRRIGWEYLPVSLI
jgi:cytochrome P450